MEKDVVCGMQIDPAKAAGSSEYQGKKYYFCSSGCKAKFDANPAQFAKSRPGSAAGEPDSAPACNAIAPTALSGWRP